MQFQEYIHGLPAYKTSKTVETLASELGVSPESIIGLGSNENPFGMSNMAKEAIVNNVNMGSKYPDDSHQELRVALAERYGVNENNVILGAGSDGVIEYCLSSMCNKGDKVLMAKYTFHMYEIYSKYLEAEVIKPDSLLHDLDQMLDLYKKHKPKVIFVCMPNNPLGEGLLRSDVLNFIEKVGGDPLIIIDGAYMEYAAYKDKNYSLVPTDIIGHDNVIYLGTFSKIYGLGGMRVGYGIANSSIISGLNKLRPPFSVSTLSLLAAVASLKDQDFIDMCLRENAKGMLEYENIATELGIDFIRSFTNFLTLTLKEDLNCTEIVEKLFKKGVIFRGLAVQGLNAVRCTIGTPEQNKRVFECLRSVVSE